MNNSTKESNKDARVKWIKEDVFPKWDEQRTQRFDDVKQHMQKIVETGRQAGGQY